MRKQRVGDLRLGWSLMSTACALLAVTPSACSSDDDDGDGAIAQGGHSAAGHGGGAGEAGEPTAGQAAGLGGNAAGGKSGGSSGGRENVAGSVNEGGSPSTTGGAASFSNAGSGGAAGSAGGPDSGGNMIEMFEGTSGMTLARDESGTLHIAASVLLNGIYTVVYARCASSCALPDSWTIVPLGLESTTSQVPTIGVTQAGLPRIYSASDDGSSQGYHYLSCDADCDDAASWLDLRLSNHFPLPNPAPAPSLPFAVSKSGAAVVASTDDLTLTISYCARSCADAASWQAITFQSNYTTPTSVVFAADESVQLVARHAVQDNQLLFWVGCSSGCEEGANWQGIDGLLTLPGQIDAAVAQTSAGGIRIATYFDDPSTNDIDHVFSMVSCDRDCSDTDNWSLLSPLPIPPQSANVGFAFALDASDQPVIAYVNDSGSGYASCSGDCTSPSGTWQDAASISSEYLRQVSPPPVPATCFSSAWQMYTGPAFALDAQGRPFVGVTSRGIGLGGQCGTGSGSAKTGAFLALPE